MDIHGGIGAEYLYTRAPLLPFLHFVRNFTLNIQLVVQAESIIP
jgi:hypothetical protein